MVAAVTAKGLALLEFGSLQTLEKDLNVLAGKAGSAWEILGAAGENPLLLQTQTELEGYFSGHLKKFTVPLDLTPSGNDFALAVWQSLLCIPYGETWTYKGQADFMCNPLAIRAIAATNGRNPIAIIVPCHRVIGSNGQLTGYAGGIEKKRWLLQLEQDNSPARPGLLF